MKPDADKITDDQFESGVKRGNHLKCWNTPTMKQEFLADSTVFLNLLAETDVSLLVGFDTCGSSEAQQAAYSQQQIFVSGILVQELCRLLFEKRGPQRLFAIIYNSWINQCTPVSAILSSANSPRETANRINALENVAMRSFRSEITFENECSAKIQRVGILPTANLPSHSIAYWGYIASAFRSSGCRGLRLSYNGRTLSSGEKLNTLSESTLIDAIELDLHWERVERSENNVVPNICAQQHRTLIRKLTSLLHEAHFYQHETSLASCALALNVSERTLQRRLNEASLSFQSLRKMLQIYYATELIAGTSLKLPEVAASANYADAAHLIRHFRDATGMTPRKFETYFLAR